MNALSPSDRSGLPALPASSRWLDAALSHGMASGDAPSLHLPPEVRPAIVAEAGALVGVLRTRMRPAAPLVWADFLRPLAAGCRNPPSEDDFRAFVASAASALTTIPAHLLTSARCAEARRRFAWWPAVADLAEWLEPEVWHERAMLAAAERIAASTSPEAERPDRRGPPTEAEIAHVQQATAALRADAKATEEAMRPRKLALRARPLTPAQLIATYEAQIAAGQDHGGCAALRLEVLRRQFGEATHGG